MGNATKRGQKNPKKPQKKSKKIPISRRFVAAGAAVVKRILWANNERLLEPDHDRNGGWIFLYFPLLFSSFLTPKFVSSRSSPSRPEFLKKKPQKFHKNPIFSLFFWRFPSHFFGSRAGIRPWFISLEIGVFLPFFPPFFPLFFFGLIPLESRRN